jgi:dephospho-CoA kinase
VKNSLEKGSRIIAKIWCAFWTDNVVDFSSGFFSYILLKLAMGNQLRNAYGPGVLAERTLRKLDKVHNYVIDSIRHPAEVDALSKAPEPYQFTLIGIDCPSEIRFRRLKERGRLGDITSLEEFNRVEELELRNPDPNGQQLLKVLERSHVMFDNSGTVEKFMAQIKALHEKLDSEPSSV